MLQHDMSDTLLNSPHSAGNIKLNGIIFASGGILPGTLWNRNSRKSTRKETFAMSMESLNVHALHCHIHPRLHANQKELRLLDEPSCHIRRCSTPIFPGKI